jgi:hypothetical protein
MGRIVPQTSKYKSMDYKMLKIETAITKHLVNGRRLTPIRKKSLPVKDEDIKKFIGVKGE